MRELLAAGYDQEQILAYFEHSYGEFVRLQPPLRGVNWLVWLGAGCSRSRPEASVVRRALAARRSRRAGGARAPAPGRPRCPTTPRSPATSGACASWRTAGRRAGRPARRPDARRLGRLGPALVVLAAGS